MNEAVPNPYNARKNWHKGGEVVHKEDSNTLFMPTRSIEDESPDTATSPKPDDVNWKKRHDDLKKHYDDKVNAHKQELEQVRATAVVEAPSAEPKAPPKTAEELEEFKESNPETYALMESITQEKTDKLSQQLEEVEERNKIVKIREAQVDLLKAHPDFNDIKIDPAFHAWAEAQDQGIQDWVYNNPYNGVLAARAIDLYKKDKGIVTDVADENTQPAVAPDVDAASLVPTRNTGASSTSEPKIWTRREIKRMSLDDYDRYEREINQAMEEGRIRP
jgi:hypothetical protein